MEKLDREISISSNKSLLEEVLDFIIPQRWTSQRNYINRSLSSVLNQINVHHDPAVFLLRNWLDKKRCRHGKAIKLHDRPIYSTLPSNAKTVVESLMKTNSADKNALA